jgi:concentrative nucleoside transporter, CNT family
MQALHALAGTALLLALAWALSEDRRGVRWRVVATGLALTVALAGLLLAVPWLKGAVFSLNAGLAALERATQAGASFVFGFLAGGPAPYAETNPAASFVLAFRALPLVVSAVSALLFHWRVLPVVVKAFAWVLNRTMGLGGAVGVSSAVNVFVGMVEAPLVVKPYLARLSRSELFMVMVCGMATIAGTVMALYGAILSPVLPDAIGHIIVASFVATPAAIVVAALMVPGEMSREAAIEIPRQDASAMDAVTRGTVEGMQLLIQIVAMLIVLVALVHLANAALSLLPGPGGEPLTLQRMLGWAFAPLAWAAGVPWAEAQAGGALLGTKTILNELVAYVDLANLPAEAMGARSRLLMTYALCGFANFGSLGILIGGMGAMVPERRGEIVALGMKSIVAGTLATCLTAAVVGLFV